MQRYLKELMLISFILATICAAFATLLGWVALLVWSPLAGGLTLFFISPFIMRGWEKFCEPEEIY